MFLEIKKESITIAIIDNSSIRDKAIEYSFFLMLFLKENLYIFSKEDNKQNIPLDKKFMQIKFMKKLVVSFSFNFFEISNILVKLGICSKGK